MYGRKVKLRFFYIFIIFLILSLTIFLTLKSLEENVIYFQSPTDVKALAEIDKKKIRIGGMVKKKSILIKEKEVKFVVTDFKNEINVIYSGLIPNPNIFPSANTEDPIAILAGWCDDGILRSGIDDARRTI